MSETFSSLVMRLGPAIGNHIWQSTVFSGIVAIVTFLLRNNSASSRSVLWTVASAKFLIPFALLTSLGSLIPITSSTKATGDQPIYTALSVAGKPFTASAATKTAVTNNLQRNSHRQILAEVSIAVWCCGAFAVLLVWYRRWRQVNAIMRGGTLASDGREGAILRELEGSLQLHRPVPLIRTHEVMEPAMFGIFCPILLWPEPLTSHLDDDHIRAILVHELCHAQRQDNLIAAVHMVVEIVFWFHPLVWWLESRMGAERERACDEAVIRVIGNPEVYAEGLLRACRVCLEAPLPVVVGIAGAGLRNRIARIMGGKVGRSLHRSSKLLLGTAGLLSIGIPLALGSFLTHAETNRFEESTWEQVGNPATTKKDTAVDLPPFAVASIRQVVANDADMMSLRFTDNGVSFRGVSIAWIFTLAFSPQPSLGVQDDLVLGLPSWTRSDRYDFEAKVDDGDVSKWKALSPTQRRLAIQPLLVARLGLAFHHENRERPTYSLVVAKNGPKLHKVQRGEVPPSNGLSSPEGSASRGESTVTPGKIVLRESSVSVLANLLSSQGLSHTVVDKTGLTDLYDITLRWSPNDIASSDASLPSLFTALREQLGLKLEYNKNPIDVIVVDHIERPSPN